LSKYVKLKTAGKISRSNAMDNTEELPQSSSSSGGGGGSSGGGGGGGGGGRRSSLVAGAYTSDDEDDEDLDGKPLDMSTTPKGGSRKVLLPPGESR